MHAGASVKWGHVAEDVMHGFWYVTTPLITEPVPDDRKLGFGGILADSFNATAGAALTTGLGAGGTVVGTVVATVVGFFFAGGVRLGVFAGWLTTETEARTTRADLLSAAGVVVSVRRGTVVGGVATVVVVLDVVDVARTLVEDAVSCVVGVAARERANAGSAVEDRTAPMTSAPSDPETTERRGRRGVRIPNVEIPSSDCPCVFMDPVSGTRITALPTTTQPPPNSHHPQAQ